MASVSQHLKEVVVSTDVTTTEEQFIQISNHIEHMGLPQKGIITWCVLLTRITG